MQYATGEAKPKISFPFFVGSPHTPRRGKEEREGKFLVFAPATEGSGRGAPISPRSDCFGKKFGFCSGDTAKLRRQFCTEAVSRSALRIFMYYVYLIECKDKT